MELSFSFDSGGENGKAKDFLLSSNLDSDWAYLFGYLIGDGCISLKGDRVSWVADQDNVDYLKNLLALKLEVNWRCREIPKKTCSVWEIYVCSVGVAQFFLNYGFKHGAPNKVIPDFLLEVAKVDPGIRKALLQGLYDSDGGAHLWKGKNGSINLDINFASVSPTLAEQVLSLTRDFGVSSKISIRKYPDGSNWCPSNIVRIRRSSDALIFFKHVGFRLQRKQNALEEFLFKSFPVQFKAAS